jgi:hypothetical protein
VGVIGAGILWPLVLHARPSTPGLQRNPAFMVLLGGLLLRVVTLLASSGIEHHMVVTGVSR